jgi:hypothetical protein
MKELYMAAHEELIGRYLEDRPDATVSGGLRQNRLPRLRPHDG